MLRHKQFKEPSLSAAGRKLYWSQKKYCKTALFVALIFGWTVVGSNLFGFEPEVEAAISVRNTGLGTTGATGTTTATTVTISVPSGTINGDVMVANITVYGTTVTFTTPTGWTLVPNLTTSGTASGTAGTDVRMNSYYKVAGFSEPASYVFTISAARQIAGGITSYTGVNTSSIFDCDGAAQTFTQTTATTNLTATTNTGCTTSFADSHVVAAYGIATQTTVTPTAGSGLTERFERSSGDLLAADATVEQASAEQVAAGVTGAKTATLGANAKYVSHLFTLRSSTHSWRLAAYRWFTNVNSVDFLGISDDISGTLGLNCGSVADKALSVAVDDSTSSIFVAGYSGCNGEQWHVERRGSTDGIKVDAFNGTGVYSYNGTATGSDRAQAIIADGNGTSGAIYVAGYETVTSAAAANKAWRIQKLSKITAAPVTAFGTNGVIRQDLGLGTGKDDQATALYIDNTNNRLYVAGEDSSPLTNSTQWRVEKRNASTGELCSTTTICPEGVFGTSGFITSNPATRADIPTAVTVDESGGYIYIAGRQDVGDDVWRVEKRNITTGALCSLTTVCSEGIFGTGGVYVSNPNTQNSTADILTGVRVQINSTVDKKVYLGGSEKSAGNNTKWRVEKINGITGTLDTTFGTGGIVNSDPDPAENDDVIGFAIDSTYNHLYVVGTDAGSTGVSSNSNFRWRVEKRNSNSGALCDGSAPGGTPICGSYTVSGVTTNFPAFGGVNGDPAGVATSDPVSSGGPAAANTDYDRPQDMQIFKLNASAADGSLYIVGFDRGASQDGSGDTEWRLEKRNLLDGTRQFSPEALAPTNSAARPQKVNTFLRLRILMALSPGGVYPTDAVLSSFRLEYAPKSGTCDSAFIGEEGFFTPVTTNSNDIRWLDNSSDSAIDGVIPRDLGASDPTDPFPTPPFNTNIIQGYEEDNPLNIRAPQLSGQNALWDLALRDVNAYGAYCFRTVYAGGEQAAGTLLNGNGAGGLYTNIPEINLCLSPTTESLLRHGNYFCGNIENPFFWSIDAN